MGEIKTVKKELESFIEAFQINSFYYQGQCNCGMKFFNPDGENWTFEDGEIEFLRADPNYTELDSNVRYVMFNNRRYVTECNCWQHRAEVYIDMLEQHNVAIVKYFYKTIVSCFILDIKLLLFLPMSPKLH